MLPVLIFEVPSNKFAIINSRSLQDASLLRFFVDMRGADVDDRQVEYL